MFGSKSLLLRTWKQDCPRWHETCALQERKQLKVLQALVAGKDLEVKETQNKRPLYLEGLCAWKSPNSPPPFGLRPSCHHLEILSSFFFFFITEYPIFIATKPLSYDAGLASKTFKHLAILLSLKSN